VVESSSMAVEVGVDSGIEAGVAGHTWSWLETAAASLSLEELHGNRATIRRIDT
jgi:hypothetical protein